MGDKACGTLPSREDEQAGGCDERYPLTAWQTTEGMGLGG